MPLVIVDTPLGETAVRSDELFFCRPNLGMPDGDTELSFDGPRSVICSWDMDKVARALGPSFVELPAASVDFERYLVNPAKVLVVIPNPDVADVCFLQGMSKRVAVKGALAAVVAALG